MDWSSRQWLAVFTLSAVTSCKPHSHIIAMLRKSCEKLMYNNQRNIGGFAHTFAHTWTLHVL